VRPAPRRGTAAAGEPAATPAGPLPERERTLLSVLSNDPRHIDALAAESRLPSAAVASALLALELKRLVRQLPGKYFVRR
jgi:DNA processing protein